MGALIVLVASLVLVAGLPQEPPPVYEDFQCTKDGKFMDPYQCDLYWVCKAGVATSILCDDGLVFDEFRGLAGAEDPCDNPLKVNCTNRELLQEPTYPSAECERRHGIFMDPDPTNCKTFHICKEGMPESSPDCSAGLHFNPVTANCEWPIDANRQGCIELQNNCLKDTDFCCDGKPVYSIHDVLIPSPTFPDPSDPKKFFVCISNVTPQKGTCDTGKEYYHDVQLCDFPKTEGLVGDEASAATPVRRGKLN